MRRLTILLAVLAVAAVAAPAGLTAMHEPSPVITVKAPKFGAILASRGHLALYTWNKEKDKKVHCTGECAQVWPPLVVAKGTMVAKHIPHVMGTFGTTVRPDGRTQVTYNGRPLYSYHQDTRTKILCDGVDGWFVVRA